MGAEEAKSYGLIDEIIDQRKDEGEGLNFS